jgi:hypothetical protein
MDKPQPEQLFAIGTETADTLVVALKSTALRLTDYRHAMLFFFCKAYKTYHAIQILWTNGYAEDATNLARSIYEIRLQVLFMSGDPLPRSQQFFDHWFKCGVGQLQILRRLFPDRQTELDENEQLIRQGVRDRATDPFNDVVAAKKAVTAKWWGPGGIRGLLEKLGLDHEREVIYYELSEHSHSGMSLLHQYMRHSDGSINLNYRPTLSKSRIVPLGALEWLLQIVGLTSQACELNLEDKLAAATAAYRVYSEATP